MNDKVNEENSRENLLVNFNCIMSIVSLYMTCKMCNNRNNVIFKYDIY